MSQASALSPSAPLEHASPGARHAEAGGILETGLPALLLTLFLLYVFVGTSPLAEISVEARAEGSPIDRLAIFTLAGLAITVIALRLRSTARLAWHSGPVWLLLAWFMASLLWSDFFDLTLRRTISLVLIALVSLSIAASIDSMRRMHTILFAVLGIVVAANLVVTIVRPDFAITDIGVRGFYTQKNQAGLVAMLAAIVALCWTLTARRLMAIVTGVAVFALSFLLLYISDSKTSLSLTLLAAAATPALGVLRRLGGATAALLGGLLATLGALLAAVSLSFGIDPVSFATADGDATFTGRAEIWDFVRSEIARRPWTGFGYGAFWDVGEAADPLLRAPPGTWLSQVETGFINQAHNGYLDLWVQAGLPAVILGLFIMLRATWLVLAGFFAGADQVAERTACLMCLVIMIVFFLHNLTESSLWARGQILANVSLLFVFMAHRAASAPATGGSAR